MNGAVLFLYVVEIDVHVAFLRYVCPPDTDRVNRLNNGPVALASNSPHTAVDFVQPDFTALCGSFGSRQLQIASMLGSFFRLAAQVLATPRRKSAITI